MTYPNKEKRRAADEDRRRRFLMQARIYDNAESFEEYVVKCAVCGINRRISAFGLVDPFWFHYKVCDDVEFIKIALCFAIPLLFAGCAITAILGRIMAAPTYTVIGGSVVGAVIWPICLRTVKNFYYTAYYLISDARDEDCGIKA